MGHEFKSCFGKYEKEKYSSPKYCMVPKPLSVTKYSFLSFVFFLLNSNNIYWVLWDSENKFWRSTNITIDKQIDLEY